MTSLAATFAEDGFVVVPGVVPTDEIDAVRDFVDRQVPRPTTAPLGDPTAKAFRAEQFVGLREFPLGDPAFDRLPVHHRLLDLVEELLGTDDVRLYQAELFTKHAGTTSFEQPLHTDWHNHVMLLPDPRYGQVQMFLYLSDVEDRHGPTHVVPGRFTSDRPLRSFGGGGYDDLYEHEVAAPGPRGSVLAYRADTVHRGVDMTEGVRHTFNLGYRVAGADWVGANPWPRKGVGPLWGPVLSSCDPRQAAALGVPAPGHPYWTEHTLAGTADRYPAWDLSPWREALTPR